MSLPNQLPFLPPQLENYLDACWIEGYFNETELDLLNKLYNDSANKRGAEVSDQGIVQPDLRKSTVAFLEPNSEEARAVIQKLGQLAIQINAQRYKFELLGFYEPLQIAEYGNGDFFDWHSDFSAGSASTRKLSLSIQLSDPEKYEGGNLQFQINTNHVNAPRTKGTVIIFPSFVLHRVTPIIRGSRRSLVGWVTGMPFK